jgi:hypothetical protein
MFRNLPSPLADTDVTVPAVPSEVVPLSVLALDLPSPATGWEPFLTVRNIAIVVDDIGRPSVSRDDAGTLIAEKHEGERRAREVAKQQEQAAIAADQAWRSQLPLV